MFWWGHLRERDHWKDIGVDGRTVIDWILKKKIEVLELIDLAWDINKLCNEHSVSKKCEEFID